jgi:soluble lytic murein transglycosylase-like protein
MRARHLAGMALCFGLAVGAPQPAQAYLDAEAAYRMALRHHHPQGGRQANYRTAMLLYCRADADDHAGAAFAIGLLYASGHSVKRSENKAAAWLRRAQALGHKDAGAMLRDLRVRPVRGIPVCPNGWGRGASAAAALRAPADIRKLVAKMAPRFRLDPKLVLAVIAVESAFQVDAVSSARAQGLMQLIPATAARFGVRDAFDPAENLRGGMAYLRWLLDHFKGDVTLALAGYNAGENAVARYGGVPPYKETQHYVRKVRRLYAPARVGDEGFPP